MAPTKGAPLRWRKPVSRSNRSTGSRRASAGARSTPPSGGSQPAVAGLTGPSSSKDKVFACPSDRGYGEVSETPVPFHSSKKHNFTSYVLNSVNLPGVPSIAGWQTSAVKDPSRTLLTMEWTAHAPLSWHRSRTRHENAPFYNDADNVVGFVDGHVSFIKIYYDGMNAAYTRDPIGGYEYKYSGD